MNKLKHLSIEETSVNGLISKHRRCPATNSRIPIQNAKNRNINYVFAVSSYMYRNSAVPQLVDLSKLYSVTKSVTLYFTSKKPKFIYGLCSYILRVKPYSITFQSVIKYHYKHQPISFISTEAK